MSVTEIGRRLKKARLDAGLTQKEVADKLNITYQAISNYERGTNRVDTDTLSMLCAIYGIQISNLLTTPFELIEETNDKRELNLSPLSPEDEMVLYNYHHGKMLIDMTQEEIELIRLYRTISPDAQGRIRNALDYEYHQLLGEETNSSAKNA